MDKISVLCGFDKKLMPYGMVSVCSLLARLETAADLEIGFVVESDVDAHAKRWMASVVEQRRGGSRIIFHPAEKLRRPALESFSRIPPIAAFKLLAGEVGFKGGRVLTVDADMLFRANVAPLFEIDLKENIIGAVEDKMVSGSLKKNDAWGAIGVRPENGYFNSGLLLIDLDRWNKSGIADKVFSLMDSASDTQLRLCEQTPLNIAVEGRWLRLDRRWNRPMSQEGLWRLSREGRSAFVWHFQSGRKPWNPFPRVDAGARAYWAEAAKLRIPLVPRPKVRDFVRGFIRHFSDTAKRMASRVKSKKLI